MSAGSLLSRRPLLVYGLLLVGPPAALAALGLGGLKHEERGREAAALDEARAAAEREVHDLATRLEALRKAEDARPYFHWQSRIMPPDVIAANGPAFVESPLATGADLPADRPTAWFQWTLSRDVVTGPEVFTAGQPPTPARALVASLAQNLVPRLRAAPGSSDLDASAPTAVPLFVVAANEEVGQLLEEIPTAQRSATNTTDYLKNFGSRVGQNGAPAAAPPTVGVRLTAFRHLLLPGDGPAGTLVAWRLVWIPGGEAKAQRDAPVDRWLLQGYLPWWSLGGQSPAAHALYPGEDKWQPRPSQIDGSALRARVRLKDRMSVEDAGAEGPVAWADADLGAVFAANRDARWRYGLTSGGLVLVVLLGFFVLTKSVRREVEAARRKEDFVAAVTHELKTPLAGIRMYAEMLGEGWVPEGGTPKEYAGRIVDETTRLATLVDRVLDFAAVDRGVVSAHLVPGDLGEAVRQAVAALEPQAAEAGVPVRVEVEEGLPLVPFDAGLLRQIVANLVDNAVKYSARSEAKDVRVSLRRDGDAVALAVADRGAGIAAEDRPRLFAPFQRGGREETRTARGVGLGLALVKRYAEAHRARVSLESEVGRGTTVTVRFPA